MISYTCTPVLHQLKPNLRVLVVMVHKIYYVWNGFISLCKWDMTNLHSAVLLSFPKKYRRRPCGIIGNVFLHAFVICAAILQLTYRCDDINTCPLYTYTFTRVISQIYWFLEWCFALVKVISPSYAVALLHHRQSETCLSSGPWYVSGWHDTK